MAGNGTGRVEVYHDGQWGTICDLGWDKNDAAVVCNQLGFVKVIHEAKNALYGQGSGPVWMGYVQCKGDEQRLTDCPNGGWGATSCKHVRDAGVKCLHEGM
ncbi:predicted protein [Nematostella vectensis]|uniref:SRCR domain-containing protein n=1 Tax=Nematostella vectensis TaxID=45351 RepID=A7SM61_NEMVE|nr:predicted protein [Nematostella vectensis]|eukprot:XP_001627314.1 predicted protein [Nematostella vectensis]